MKAKTLTALCLGYLFFLVYASLMPFDFSATREQVADQFRHAWWYWPFDDRLHTSKADVVSNLLLYIPAGFLIAAVIRAGRRSGFRAAAAWAAAVCFFASAGVESLQAFSQSRVTSAQDLLMNTLGGIAGGLAGAHFGRRWWAAIRRRVRLTWASRPAALVGPGVMILLAADALYPYLPTLDVSELRSNVRHSIASLTQGFGVHPWHHWLAQRVGAYGFLAAMLAIGTARDGKPRWVRGAAWTILFACLTEAAKVFISSRFANAANVVWSICGAIAGAAGGMMLHRMLPRRCRVPLVAILLAGFVAYLELDPFQFTWDPAGMASRAPSGAEWLPLYQYAMHGGIADVRMFASNLVTMAGTAAAAVLALPWLRRGSPALCAAKCAALAALFGTAMEAAQFLLPTRTPSTTDVFVFALGGAIGGYLSRSRAGAVPSGRPADDPGGTRCS